MLGVLSHDTRVGSMWVVFDAYVTLWLISLSLGLFYAWMDFLKWTICKALDCDLPDIVELKKHPSRF